MLAFYAVKDLYPKDIHEKIKKWKELTFPTKGHKYDTSI